MKHAVLIGEKHPYQLDFCRLPRKVGSLDCTMAQRPSFRVLLRETILGYLFWNFFWNLPPSVWFYPLNEMGVTGYESAAVAWFSPLLFAIPGLSCLLKTRFMLAIIRMVTVGCLYAHHSSGPLPKLLISCLGNATLLLSTTVSLWSLSVNVRRSTIWGLIIGYFATISLRVWTYTFMPAWFSTESNIISFVVCGLATLDKIFSGDDWHLGETNQKPSPKVKTNWIASSAGFASWVYLNYWVFGEVSLITRWAFSTYPSPGPQPLPFG